MGTLSLFRFHHAYHSLLGRAKAPITLCYLLSSPSSVLGFGFGFPAPPSKALCFRKELAFVAFWIGVFSFSSLSAFILTRCFLVYSSSFSSGFVRSVHMGQTFTAASLHISKEWRYRHPSRTLIFNTERNHIFYPNSFFAICIDRCIWLIHRSLAGRTWIGVAILHFDSRELRVLVRLGAATNGGLLVAPYMLSSKNAFYVFLRPQCRAVDFAVWIYECFSPPGRGSGKPEAKMTMKCS